MPKIFHALLLASLSISPAVLLTPALGQAGIRKERIQFKPGRSSAVVQDLIIGYEIVDYILSAREGQYMNVSMATDNTVNYFNILAPGEEEVAMFNSSLGVNQYEGILPKSGDYKIRVYMMRSAARRNETANYRLEMIITGSGDRSAISSNRVNDRRITIQNTNVQAQNSVGNLQDLVGARGRSGESALQQRGYRFVRTDKSNAGVYQYWRENRSGRCVTIRVDQGRYQSFVYTPEFDCQNQAFSGTGSNTIQCRFNGQPLTCKVYVDYSEAATFVNVTFPDGFTRQMRFEQGDFYSDGLEVRTGLEKGMFIVSNDNREYFEIPRAWFD